MSKKNKDIEVRIEEEKQTLAGVQITVTKLLIGKKEIGRIIPKDEKRFTIEMNGGTQATVKTVDEGIESIIRQWNLAE
ncbi:DUF2969 domain-containing protein [Enterococcus sp. BWB1-3]|uniref:DUF2969 domain-containing protein n=1 Tax=unclassified Enterococcus TaxID=2608891 RepID=UPI001924D87F|nr:MULTISPECIES: DUF2969 domain-containing protein [unclassified Enterococcus]MBL1229239.1 DUF2969 domain-containing protein [Enterococcus sp. BWB1-3]MCB5951729.1 DUF2969 domain-containing protein [Enterococcus sp. BWT-B8]MCB5955788.1 DUF2969 domain-containing protein [Enterococcus sp. CWB-B31]